jgi:hypothetical protein
MSSAIIDSSQVSNLSDKLHSVDFHSPAKIFQNKHAIHQFENVTPDVSMPGTPLLTPQHNNGFDFGSDSSSAIANSPSLPPTADHTPPSLSPQSSGEEEPRQKEEQKQPIDSPAPSSSGETYNEDSSPSNSTLSIPLDQRGVPTPSSSTSLPARPTTPSQFVFKRPQYNKEYHHTHFHHLEKKDTIFHDLKRMFKPSKDKANKDGSKSRSRSASVKSKSSQISFANEFNKNLEEKYGKWGKLLFLFRLLVSFKKRTVY